MKGTARTVGIVMIIMLFSRLLAFLSSIVYMTFFGVSLQTDIYSYAIQFPNIVFNSFGTALATVVIPIFAGYMGTGEKDRAFKFADNVLSLSIVFAAGLSVLGILLAPVFPLFTSFKNEGYDFAVLALRIMFPVMIFYALNYVLQGVLQSLGRFNMPAFVSVPSSLVLILYVFLMGHAYGILGLVVATFIGLSLQGLILIPPVFKTEYRFKPSFDLKNEDVKKALRLIPPILIGTSAYQVNMLFNITITANFKETVAIMVFVQNVILYSALAFVYSITAVVFPRFTMLAAQNDMDGFKDSLVKVLKTIAYFLVPATAGFIAVRHPLMDFLVGWGKITSGDVKLASSILALYAVGISGVGIKEVVDRAFYSIKDTRRPAINSLVVVLVNIGASLILIQYFGALGIPLAYSISSLTGVVVLVSMLRRKIGAFGLGSLVRTTLKILLSSAVMFAVVWLVDLLLGELAAGGVAAKAARLFIPVAAGILVYFVSTMLLKVEEAVEVMNKVKLRLRPG